MIGNDALNISTVNKFIQKTPTLQDKEGIPCRQNRYKEALINSIMGETEKTADET